MSKYTDINTHTNKNIDTNKDTNKDLYTDIECKNIGKNQIDKHVQFKSKYPTNTIFWGIGIENEFYLEFEKKKIIDKNTFKINHKRERYSVDYYTNYNSDLLTKAFEHTATKLDNNIEIPILLNAHSFTKTDKNNNSMTTYTKNPQPNPKFIGKSLIEELRESDKYFIETENTYWTFDGDTIEIININFANIKLNDLIEELISNKKTFELKLQENFQKLEFAKSYGNIKIMTMNHPWATYMTNFNNVAMFNNGTLHYNITLPCKLDAQSQIINKKKFISEHQKAIKIIQWMEPIIIAMFGSKDPFSVYEDLYIKNKFSVSSQRCAISRYIGIGIYDTDKMEPGKILTKPISEIEFSNDENWWYNKYHQSSAYNKLEQIGLDINFNKHYSHGIELRFFEHLEKTEDIYESFEFVILLIDWILDKQNNFLIPNPIINVDWNNVVCGILSYGKDYLLSESEILIYSKLFKIQLEPNCTIKNFYKKLRNKLIIKYSKVLVNKNSNNQFSFQLNFSGEFSKYVINQKDIDVNLHKELYDYYCAELTKQMNKLDITDHNQIILESDIQDKINLGCCLPWFLSK